MGKQDHSFPISGRIGKLTFYRHKLYGPMVKEARGISKDRIENDPSFENTRKTMAEFSRSGKAAKLFRTVLRNQLMDINDGRMISRLNKALMNVLKTDDVNDHGKRTITDGELELLKDFDFNTASLLKSCLLAPFTTTIDRSTGVLTVTIPSYLPQSSIKAPKNATHYHLIVVGAEMDLANNKGTCVVSDSGPLDLEGTATTDQTISLQVAANSPAQLFIFLGISFEQEALNGSMKKLNNGAFNAFSIIDLE